MQGDFWRNREGRAELVGRNLEDMLTEAEFQCSLPWIQRALAGETVSTRSRTPGTARRGTSPSPIFRYA